VDAGSAIAADGQGVLALRRGLAILDCFGSPTLELGVNEMARMLGMHKSTISRLCATLEQAGYLHRELAAGRYRLGPRIFNLAGNQNHEFDLRSVARPILQRLVAATGETVTIAELEGPDIVTIDVIEGTNLVRAQARVGARTQAHASATAKAILAYLPTVDRDAIIDGLALVQLSPNTLTSRDALVENLETIRQRGWSVDMEELEVGLRCIGAPVRDGGGHVIAAIAILGPRHRMTEAAIPVVAPQVVAAANEISRALGLEPGTPHDEAR
jgi:DNA-binding IclR family transcriptional regulator